jgi:hypothetical protein
MQCVDGRGRERRGAHHTSACHLTASLSPTRRGTGHHLSIFIDYLMTRKNIMSPEGVPESALREALRTTTYLPPEWVYDNFKVSRRSPQLLSPSLPFFCCPLSSSLPFIPTTLARHNRRLNQKKKTPTSIFPGRSNRRGAVAVPDMVPALRLPRRSPGQHVRKCGAQSKRKMKRSPNGPKCEAPHCSDTH